LFFIGPIIKPLRRTKFSIVYTFDFDIITQKKSQFDILQIYLSGTRASFLRRDVPNFLALKMDGMMEANTFGQPKTVASREEASAK
jgi:hypothetical protein